MNRRYILSTEKDRTIKVGMADKSISDMADKNLLKLYTIHH